MELEVFRNEGGFAALRGEWPALLARSASNTLFLTWEWQSTWWHYLGDGELWLLAWREGEDLTGIAPLYLHGDSAGKRRLSIVGCIEVSDYLDLIVASGREREVYQALLAWLQGPDAPAWDVLDLCNLPQQSLAHQLLPELAAAAGLEVQTEVEDVCPIISLPGDWEDYLQECLSKKQRHEVRRKMRKIEREAEVERQVVDGQASLAGAADQFLELHRLSSEDKQDFMTPAMETFFREIMAATHKAGWLALSFLVVNGREAAAMLNFHYGDRVFVYNSGYDPDLYAELSPGIVLTCYVIQDAIAQGFQVFDFLQGDEVYKYRFGATDTPVYRTQITKAP